jgi:hypothetical protein
VSYDIHIQIVPATQYTGMAFYSFGQTRSLGVRGLQKLVNIFAKFLLTPIGTDLLDPTYGTNMTGLIGSNVALNDAREILDLAVASTMDAIFAFQSGKSNIPNDERLATAAVTNYILIPDGPGFAAQILITNVSRQQLQLVLPTLQVRR